MEQSDRCRNRLLWTSWGEMTQSSQRRNCSIKSRISADLLWLPFDAPPPFSRRDTICGFAVKLNRIEWVPEIKISHPWEENLWISADLKNPGGRDGVGTLTLKFSRQHFSHEVIMLMLLCNAVSPGSVLDSDLSLSLQSPASPQIVNLHFTRKIPTHSPIHPLRIFWGIKSVTQHRRGIQYV